MIPLGDPWQHDQCWIPFFDTHRHKRIGEPVGCLVQVAITVMNDLFSGPIDRYKRDLVRLGRPFGDNVEGKVEIAGN